MRSDPSIQKLHLFPGMEPVLPAGHNGQICMMLPCKCRYRFDGCQVIVLAVENTGGNIPDDRVFPHVTKICPGQRFPELRGDFPLLGKLLFGHIRPLHHLADQVFHIHNRRDQISPVNQRIIQRRSRKESPDAVRDQDEVLTPISLPGKKCEKRFFGFPMRA